MFKVHSYTGPYTDKDADYPSLDINMRTHEPMFGDDGVHWGCIQVHGNETIQLVLGILTSFGVPEHG